METKEQSIVKILKNWFLTGLFILLPVGVTAIVVSWLLNSIGAPIGHFFWNFLGIDNPDKFWMNCVVNILATALVVLVITVLGIFSKYFLGRTIISLTEKVINRVPFVNSLYRTVKQIVETFNKNREAVFQTAVLVEYPRKGIYSIGFLTSETKGEVQIKTREDVVNVFIPTTPNPTSGFLLLVPKDDIIYLQMTVSDAMKMIISGGVVNPEYNLHLEGNSRDGFVEK